MPSEQLICSQCRRPFADWETNVPRSLKCEYCASRGPDLFPRNVLYACAALMSGLLAIMVWSRYG